jgi:gluconolactonase
MFFPRPVAPLVGIDGMKVCAENLDHPEGLAFSHDGVLWAGGEAGQLYRIEGSFVQQVGSIGGFCLGITVSPAQDLIVCNSGLHALQQVDRNGRVTNCLERVADRRLMTPNFSVFSPEGDLYFSDSGEWNGGNGCIYRVRKSGKAEWFAGPFFFANGLSMSSSGDRLFVVESQRDRVLCIPIAPNGNALEAEVYAKDLARIPDGAALDLAGNLYVTCYATDCIYRVRPDRTVELFAFDPEGTILARPTNVAFGGSDGKTLVAANLGRWHLTQISVDVPGMLLAGQKGEQK